MADPIPQLEYDHDIYHAATNLSLGAAIQVFEASDAQQAVNTVIRDCFLRHNVEDRLSACIIHRHFDLSRNERNIEEGGRAFASSDLEGIHPCSWLYYEGKLVPYEFTRVRDADPAEPPVLPPDFVTDLGHILQARDLCHVIGIQTYTDGVVGVESTNHETRVSTTVQEPEASYQPSEKYRPASFAFFRPE